MSRRILLFLLCIASGCRPWTREEDTNRNDGVRIGHANIHEECRMACKDNASCTAIDFNEAADDGQKCWIHGHWSGEKSVGNRPGIIHERYDRLCDTGGSNEAKCWYFQSMTTSVLVLRHTTHICRTSANLVDMLHIHIICSWITGEKPDCFGLHTLCFLADRTNGRAYATLLHPSVVVCRRLSVCLSVCNVMYCG